jgi:hypothetical protein
MVKHVVFLKTCKARFSLRGENFTTRNFRRTPKELRNKNRKLRGERRGGGCHHTSTAEGRTHGNTKASGQEVHPGNTHIRARLTALRQ